MKVKLASAQKIGGKHYKPGEHHVLDKMAHLQDFKKKVQQGAIVMLPRDEKEQSVLHMKNELAAQEAMLKVESKE